MALFADAVLELKVFFVSLDWLNESENHVFVMSFGFEYFM